MLMNQGSLVSSHRQSSGYRETVVPDQSDGSERESWPSRSKMVAPQPDVTD